MNVTHRTALLTKLSKIYVFDRLGLDPRTFERTADSAWVEVADRLLQRHPRQPSTGTRRAGRTVSSK
jgi:hypothetical protein